MKGHWTQKRAKDFLFRISADFIAQLEDMMDSKNIKQNKFARKLKVSSGRVSQIMNNPGNISLQKMIEYARALNLKVAVVAYEDDDPNNEKGPINSEIFKMCWERQNKPRDFWAIQDHDELRVVAAKKTVSNPVDIVKIYDLGFSVFCGSHAMASREWTGMYFNENMIGSFASPSPGVVQG